MKLADRIFPKARDFQNFAPPEGELPNRAFPFIWIFVKALRWSLGFALITFVIGVACTSSEPWFFGRLVDAFAHTDRAHTWTTVLPIIVGYIGITQIVGRGLSRISAKADSFYRPILAMLVRRRLASYLFSHSYRYFQDDFSGRLAGKVVEMPQAVQDAVGDITGNFIWYAINGIISILLFATVGWQFSIACILFFIGSGLIGKWRLPILSEFAEKAAAKNQLMRGKYIDAIGNILIVKVFGRERHEEQLFSTAMIHAGAARQTEQRQGNFLWTAQEIVSAIFQSGILLMSIKGYRDGVLSPGQVATALALGLSLALNIAYLLLSSTRYFSNIATINEALATIVVPSEVQDIVKQTSFSPPYHSLKFDHVTFGYPGRSIFTDFSLSIPHGQRVGLVGPSGAGKSTLVQLVLRLFDVQEGAISIGGQNIAQVAQNDLRSAIAMIPQATDLMHRSIRDNIAYGNLDASEEQIIEAAKRAYIHDTILGLRDSHGNSGFDAMVGERGVKLSGGQRQRIAIARAFLKNAPILILDEATSALDSESERLIQQSLNELFEGRTVLAIAHRLSTIAHLDRIVVLEDGRIVEDGPHAELVNAGGLYARLWQLQSEGFIG